MQQTADKQCHGEKVTIDLVDFCRRATDDARRRHGRSVDMVFRTGVPSAYSAVDVVGMQPVFDSLFDFAVANSINGGSISIDVAANDGKVVVGVGVPGLRIKNADMPFVFNRYFMLTDAGMKSNGEVNALALVNEFAVHNNASASIGYDGGATRISIGFEMLNMPATSSMSRTANDTQHVVVPATPDNADARLFAKITDTVEAHIADSDFNVTRLQETLGIGSKLLYRKVKQMTGKPPVEFIRHIRMQRAAVLLREGRFSVSEVMYMVGFSNSSYFSKIFQKTYGITPADYAHG